MNHPLDRPVWTALTGRQQAFAAGDAATALRFSPEINILAASADASSESLAALAALAPPGGALVTVEGESMPVPPGLTVTKQAMLVQMLAEHPAAPEPFDHLALSDADAPEMLELATLTRPGPFVSHTHRLGSFIGVRVDGRLVAMAGERMRAPGLTEVSAVCTHPDFRGRGYAGRLMRIVMAHIVAAGETPFLHSYADNHGAIALYETIGFRIRREVIATFFQRGKA
ncbi:GNAT family N-acetyltransferase [Sphingomonas sp. MG17]|uniref:GNAT family N-acetyltransferase n=1 Tax=Sphingomonas tagetis TaxID=2949092 RepID=A0A9X2HJ09_9SPHN|nr:GNAT family N-acetyltransferase [Sphingomonas tagetis]